MTKQEQLVANVRRSIDSINPVVAPDRREFFQGFGMALLTVQCLPVITHGAENPPGGKETGGSSLIIQSGPGLFDHAHDLLIPYALLKAPPLKGVQLTSTEAMFHRHTIALSQKELTVVNQGGTVTQKASSHYFVIALAKAKAS